MNKEVKRFRVLRSKSNGLMYIAMADLLPYISELKGTAKTLEGRELLESITDDFIGLVYRGLDE